MNEVKLKTSSGSEDVIILEKQEDGNWKAKGIRFGKEVQTREISPENALQAFLTHDGR